MADPTVRAEHAAYTTGGDPIVRRIFDVQCLSSLPEFIGSQHVGFTAGGLPIGAWAWECCDAFCTDAEELAGTCRVRTDCQPGGIPRRLMAYLTEVNTCFTARNKRTILEYVDDPGNPLDGTWYGEVELRGGTLEIVFTCIAGPTYTLSLGGCQAASPGATTISCTDPLNVSFNNIFLDDCCDCHQEGTPNPLARLSDTDEAAEINITVVGDCRKTIFAEHVGYLDDGTPVVAYANPCAWAAPDHTATCNDMKCGLLYDITPVSGCACMEMSQGNLDYRLGEWVDDGGDWGCSGGVKTVTVTCTDNGDGTLRIGVTIVCGVTAGGFGFTNIQAEDLEDIDVTISVGISTTDSECCSGTVDVRIYRPA